MSDEDEMIKITPNNPDPREKEASDKGEKVLRDKTNKDPLDNPMDKVAFEED
jgi:hypothetical protein